MFLGLVFDVFNHESYTRHIFTNATVKKRIVATYENRFQICFFV